MCQAHLASRHVRIQQSVSVYVIQGYKPSYSFYVLCYDIF